MPAVDASNADCEYVWLSPEMPRIEPSLDGDAARALSGARPVRSSGSAVLSPDIPGNGLLPTIEAVSDRSSWFLLNAADPNPRSCVCLNHVGSFEPRVCEIWLLGTPSSFVGARSAAVDRDVEAGFSEAATDNGRLLGPVDPRDEGRCCHESVPAREGAIAALGEGVEIFRGFGGGCGSSRGKASELRSLILLGPPLVSSGRWLGGGWKDMVLEKSSWLDMPVPERMELGVPACEDWSLVGEIDRARSVPSH